MPTKNKPQNISVLTKDGAVLTQHFRDNKRPYIILRYLGDTEHSTALVLIEGIIGDGHFYYHGESIGAF